MIKAVVTVSGNDKVGIIAAVTSMLAENGANILDISQTIMSGNMFVMLALLDIGGCKISFHELRVGLEKLGEELGVSIRLQRQEIFEAMHTI